MGTGPLPASAANAPIRNPGGSNSRCPLRCRMIDDLVVSLPEVTVSRPDVVDQFCQ
jgi:hypothetical protein